MQVCANKFFQNLFKQFFIFLIMAYDTGGSQRRNKRKDKKREKKKHPYKKGGKRRTQTKK